MKYPMGIQKTKIINHGNRGMDLEHDINETNQFYLNTDRAVIYKKPTPITITKVDFPSRKEAVIKEGYFKKPSTTDYNGIYRKRYIDFEAKETKLDFFPLRNIHEHQIEHLRKIEAHGGIGFLIVKFSKLNKIFLLESKKLILFIDNNKKKRIPIDYFLKEGYIIKEKINPRVDYLSVIDQLYFKEV